MRVLTRGIIAATIVTVAIFALAISANAQQATVGPIPAGTTIRAPEGTVHELGAQQVPASLVGGTCDVTVTGANNESVHPDNDILVVSANEVTVADVEAAAGAESIPADGPLELAATVTVSVRIGPDGVFSGGVLAVEFDCTPPPPPTTAPPSFSCVNPDGTVVTTNVENSNACTPAPPVTTPPAAPPTTLPRTGDTPLALIVIGGLALSLGAAILIGKSIKRLDGR